MTDVLFLSREQLAALVADLVAADTIVIGPARAGGPAIPGLEDRQQGVAKGAFGTLEYREVRSADELELGPGMPRLSLKQFFLPQNEKLFSWKQKGINVEVHEVPTAFAPRVILGGKPCDVAALGIVDRVMNWDFHDELWNARRSATTIFSLSCGVEDQHCFCTAVGTAPDDTKGADALLIPVEGGYLMEATTDKGRALVEAHAARFKVEAGAGGAEHRGRQAAEERAAARVRVAANLEIDAESVRDWIDTHFEDPLLAALGVRCNGCGACSSVCPTCHCFDIVDEEEGIGKGTRRRCWDTCQAPTFTLHASGHNPRDSQNPRYRQRINHKFSIYPLKFGEVLCTGCGRCTRVCHAGQDLVEILQAIDIAARRPEAAAAAVAGAEPAGS